MNEDNKENNKMMSGDERISHRNTLWFIYRALAEEEIKYELGTIKKKEI